VARAKRFYLCNLIPLWEIDDERLEVDWLQEKAQDGNVVEMQVVARDIDLSAQSHDLLIEFEIFESDFLFSGWDDDHVLTIRNQPSVKAKHEFRPLKVLDEDQSPPLDQRLKYIFLSRIEGEEDGVATLIQTYWKAKWQEDVVADPEYYFDVSLKAGEEEYEERSDRELTVSAPHPVEIVIETQDSATGEASSLRHAWVYWREEGSTRLLRTDHEGRLFAAPEGAERSHPWKYETPFKRNAGINVELYYSRGAKPISDAVLTSVANVFQSRTIDLPKVPEEQSEEKKQSKALVRLPEVRVELTTPMELSLWPLLWELPADAYHTDGLNQGAALWAGGNLTVAEHGAAPAPSANARPKERGLRIAGRVDARATGLLLKVLDSNGNAITLVEDAHAMPLVLTDRISARLGAKDGNWKPFEAVIFFDDAANMSGSVRIIVQSEGIVPPIFESYYVHLANFQIALVDDYSANTNGQQRGPLLGESDEIVIVDFLRSPQLTSAAYEANTRARRVISYRLANETRGLNPALPAGPNNPDVVKPQMPMWMAELQVIGVTRAQLEELMAHRHFKENLEVYGPPAPARLRFELQWRLTLSWDGPDSNTAANHPNFRPKQSHDYCQVVQEPTPQVVELHFRDEGHLIDPRDGRDVETAAREAPNAFQPAPAPIPFPVNSRRLPRVLVSGQNRTWGRHAGAVRREALVIEYQPRIADGANNEIIRGGDGILDLLTLAVDGRNIDAGLVLAAPGTLGPPLPSDPVVRLPRFRIRGRNSAPADVETLIDALVQEYHRNNAAAARIQLLPLNIWQDTARRIFDHETGGDYHQFDERTARDRRRWRHWRGRYYGYERDMPLFGPPHGYGIGQLDLIFGRGANDDEVWSFVENLRSAVRLIMEEKATGAYNLFTAGAGAVAFNGYSLSRRRAMYQREIVRGYNGGREFRFIGGNWVINPSLPQWDPQNPTQPYDNLLYPNRVLGTNVVYFTNPINNAANNANAGPATQFNWPINFAAANYGPGI
jgi:hypothetical protein